MRRFFGSVAIAATYALATSAFAADAGVSATSTAPAPSALPVAPSASAFPATRPATSSTTPFPTLLPVPSAVATPIPPSPLVAPFPAPSVRPSMVTISTEGGLLRCNEQDAQPFLIRGNWFPRKAEAAKAGMELLKQAIDYRTEKYGQFPGFGAVGLNAHPPKFYAESTTFLGLPIQLNRRIIPALKCVESALTSSGLEAKYKPSGLSGIRFSNTYRGVEISNHVYGIAIDIDPGRNSCCGCVAPWPDNPICKKKGTPYDRMAMPRSWVETFERFGFYWLGHDALQDTMHFEFLGDPDKIVSK